jgi:hypothetical protein
VTCHAFHAVSELALEIVDDEAVVREAIKVPFLLACDLGRESLQFCFAFWTCFNVVTVKNTVQVLVKAVEQKYHELLRVVLI